MTTTCSLWPTSCFQGDVVSDDGTVFELAACAMQAQFGEFRRSDLLSFTEIYCNIPSGYVERLLRCMYDLCVVTRKLYCS